jgi:NADPH2:quinone reductase
MRAVLHSAGHGQRLRVDDIPAPQPGTDEVLIEVSLCGVNYSDLIGLHTGNNFLGAKPSHPVPGGEVVGRRMDTGERVVAICGSGGYAEQVAAPTSQVFAIPDDIEDSVAIGLFIQGLTAWHIVATIGRVSPIDRLLVPSAAGGVGLLALQIARTRGAARVVAAASSDAKRELALANGADATVRGDSAEYATHAVAANEGLPFDLVLDRSGGDMSARLLAVTAPRGRMVCFGTSSGQPGQLATNMLIAGSRTVSGFWLMDFLRDVAATEAALRELFAAHRAAVLAPHIGLLLPLERAEEAHRAVASRETMGKVLLVPGRV